MASENLFTSLSAFRPGTRATPFENYCTSALAYFLQAGDANLDALIADVAGLAGDLVLAAVPQRELTSDISADLVLEMRSSKPIIVDVEVDMLEEGEHLPELADVAKTWDPQSAFVVVALAERPVPTPWRLLTWTAVADSLRNSPNPLASEFVEFIDRDVLGQGSVSLQEAVTTNRLYALGAASVRRHFGESARYINSASRPMGGRYRYLGTTFSTGGLEMDNWIGIVNETIPLGEHYVLMLASKSRSLAPPAEHPRATAEWKWPYWTGAGRVVRPIEPDNLEGLLDRMA